MWDFAAEAAIKMTPCHENWKTHALSPSVSFSHVYCPVYITANKDAKSDFCSTHDARVSIQYAPNRKTKYLELNTECL